MTLPASFLQSISNAPGYSKIDFVNVHQSGEQVTSIRINPGKNVEDDLCIRNYVSHKIPWSSCGYYLTERPSFTLDPHFHAGAYYVQEASSMFLEQALIQTAHLQQPLKILDLCAAPGGKSTLIQSLLNKNSLLVSNEVIKTRVHVLAENITKWGADNVVVTNNDPKDFKRLPAYFDVIVVDAPCSGSGLFRKDPAAAEEWSVNNVQLCSHRQQRITADVLPALKEDGILIYSTCSYSPQEDEDIADWLVNKEAMESVPLSIQPAWGIVPSQSAVHKAYGYRFYPDKLKGEGFFIAVFRKKREEIRTPSGKIKNKKSNATVAEKDVLKNYITNSDEYFFARQNDQLLAVPLQFENDLHILQAALYIKKAGVRTGAVIRHGLIPDHELAVSNIISSGVPHAAVDEATALQYLRRQEFILPDNIRGWHLVTHRKLALGWVKILPGRVNNYYPREWRILNK